MAHRSTGARTAQPQIEIVSLPRRVRGPGRTVRTRLARRMRRRAVGARWSKGGR